MNNGKEGSREEFVRLCHLRWPGRRLVIAPHVPYPLRVARERGEVWVVDADKDCRLYSSPPDREGGYRRAIEDMKRALEGPPPASLLEREEWPLPAGFTRRLREELLARMELKEMPEQRFSTLESFNAFGPWLGVGQ